MNILKEAISAIPTVKHTFEKDCETFIQTKLSDLSFKREYCFKIIDNDKKIIQLSETLVDRSSDVFFYDKNNTIFVPDFSSIGSLVENVPIKDGTKALLTNTFKFEIKRLSFC